MGVARYSSRGAKAGWEGAAMLDGRVADAVLGGHGAVGEDGLSGAGVDAAGAGAAAVGDGGGGDVVLQRREQVPMNV